MMTNFTLIRRSLLWYIEQLVASAEAAVEEVIRRGVSDPNKIAVGGHSYGAFMTANLLAHAPHLFCCGIAISGAYNRTLTPFGFQVVLPIPVMRREHFGRRPIRMLR